MAVVSFSLLFELVLTVVLTVRFHTGYGMDFGAALYEGLFHAVSAFNNAGFARYADSLVGFVTDLWLIVPITVGFVFGGLGFPVLYELWRGLLRRQRRWSLHVRVTLIAYAALAVFAVFGVVAITGMEWTSPGTLGPMGWADKPAAGAFHGKGPSLARHSPDRPTDEEAMRQLGVPDYTSAVVAIGTDLEAGVLTTSLLADFGVPNIWAKATSRQHGRILERMGERVAHLVTDRMLDFIEFEDDYAMAKSHASAGAVGVPLGVSRLRTAHGITVVAIKRPGQGFTYATAETVPAHDDVLIVAGGVRQVEAFANLA